LTNPINNPSSHSKATLSLILGLLTVTLIPVISLLAAPCGFPLSLLSGITAIVVGGQANHAIALRGAQGAGGAGQARAGVIAGWIGLVLNFLIMMLKLAMFIGLIALPIAAIYFGTKPK
jgi:hypothetical protein